MKNFTRSIVSSTWAVCWTSTFGCAWRVYRTVQKNRQRSSSVIERFLP